MAHGLTAAVSLRKAARLVEGESVLIETVRVVLGLSQSNSLSSMAH